MIPQKKLFKPWLIAVVLLAAACSDDSQSNNSETLAETKSDVLIPQALPYSIVNQFPHDVGAFTEGLEYHDGFLYESTGQYGQSELRKVTPETGEVVKSVKMESRYFGEGMTILNNKIYQLTYKSGKGFVYDLETLKQESSFVFSNAEGWGMTNNGTHLIFCDGGNVLYFAQPGTMQIVKQLNVTDEHGPVNEVNELELINGYIYANQWRSERILKIDTTTGKVVARADLNGLRESAGIPQFSGRPGQPDVLNGIAYDAKKNRIFITGKNWPKLFEVRLDN